MSVDLANPTPHPLLGHVETVIVDRRRVACDGGLTALGHPRVWLEIKDEQTFCPYCSRLFVLSPDAEVSDAH